MADLPLAGRTVGITADRRWEEQAHLFRTRGADVLHGPTLQTIDLRGDAALRRVTDSLIADPPDWLVATTGFGMRLWLEAAESWGRHDGLVAALSRARRVARGAKSRSALAQAGLAAEWTAPGESMVEVVAHLRQEAGLDRARVAVQLFDPDDHPRTVALRAACRELVEVPLYRWALPDDHGPAIALARAAAARRLDAVTFTSQPAVWMLFRMAEAAGIEADLRDALDRDVLPVCIGPVCAEAAVGCGVDADRIVWPEPFRLVPMVKLVEARLGTAP